MKIIKSFLPVLLLISGIVFAACSNASSNSDSGSKSKPDSKTGAYIGTKAPEEEKNVGDIVFNDGSAMPYSVFSALENNVKKEKKTAAIALIFYKGRDLNNEMNGETDTTTERVLGVGLKHNKKLAWCLASAEAYQIIIDTIKCRSLTNDKISALSFIGTKNGRNNLELLSSFLNECNYQVDDTNIAENYPAFYFAKKYKDEEGSNISGTKYENGWYFPSIAELFQIYACREDTINGFDIDKASEELGGDKFGDNVYRSSSQYAFGDIATYGLIFNNGHIGDLIKWGEGAYICAIREFNEEGPVYTVTYVDGIDDNEIVVPIDAQQYHVGDVVPVKFKEIGLRDGYKLSGWRNGSSFYTYSGAISFLMGDSDVTLTAEWELVNP